MPEPQPRRQGRAARAGRVGLALALSLGLIAASAAGVRLVNRWRAANPAFAGGAPEAEAERESSDVRAGRVGLALALFVCFVAASAAGLREFYHWLAPDDAFAPVQTFSQPRLLTTPDDMGDPALAAQAAALNSYRWVDQAHGVVQAPIGRAMSLVAARGADAYAPPPDPHEAPP